MIMKQMSISTTGYIKKKIITNTNFILTHTLNQNITASHSIKIYNVNQIHSSATLTKIIEAIEAADVLVEVKGGALHSLGTLVARV